MLNKPKFIISKKVILNQYNKVRDLADITSYSSKTNPYITPILEKETDCMFSIHFINELKHVEDKSRVLFLAQAWDDEEIKILLEQNVKSFVVDNETDLDILLNYLKNNSLAEKINLLLRLKLKERTVKTERYFVFGISEDQVNKRIKEIFANENIMNKIEMLGVHFHRKTQNLSEWDLEYELSDILNKDVLEKINVINIGGGLPSHYANTNVKVFQGIYNKILKFKSWLNKNNIKMMIEPGRFIAAPAGKLVTKIIGKHDNNLIVNASVYNSDMDALIVPVKLLVENELTKEEGSAFVIKGVTPCSLDLFRYRVYLKNPQVGDEIVFINAGAYNFTSNFCDLEEIETVIVGNW